jgi:hypothetical protein
VGAPCVPRDLEVAMVARGTHCATCARVTVKRGGGSEGGHAYIRLDACQVIEVVKPDAPRASAK